MKKSIKWAAISAGAIGLVAVPLIALSSPGDCGFGNQRGGMQGSMGGGNQGMMGGGMHRSGMQSGRGPERMLEKISSYKEELAITESQEPAWNAFITTMKEGIKQHSRTRQENFEKRIDSPSVSAVAISDDRLKMMGEGLARMTQMNNALKELYANLTEEQQGKVDQLIAKRQHHRGF